MTGTTGNIADSTTEAHDNGIPAVSSDPSSVVSQQSRLSRILHTSEDKHADNIELQSALADGQRSPPEGPPPFPERSKAQKRTETFQFLSLCGTLFVAGWNDASAGPLIPRMQEYYNIGFAVVSLIFVFACVGFLSGVLMNVFLSDRLGFGKIITLASIFQVIAYAIQAAAPPFPVFVFAYVINGIGMSIQDAQANAYIVMLKDNTEEKIGIAHATYGAAALCAPLVATQFSQIKHWNFYYLCSVGVASVNTIGLLAALRLKTQDECLAKIGQGATETGSSEHSKFRQIMTLKAMHILAFFILVYVGVEVTIGGWIVSFVIRVRGGGPSSGYVSSGFFGGLMLGRVVLIWVNKKIGERRALFIYSGLAIGLELVVWLVPSLIGDAVAVSIVGLMLGPFYPISMNHSSKIIPQWLLSGSIGWIAGLGQAGTAIFPFIAGALAQTKGIITLQPLLVAMMVLMLALWAAVPNHPRRAD